MLITLLIMEICDSLVLCTVPRRGKLGDPLLVSAQSCSAPWLRPAVGPRGHGAPSSGARVQREGALGAGVRSITLSTGSGTCCHRCVHVVPAVKQ